MAKDTYMKPSQLINEVNAQYTQQILAYSGTQDSKKCIIKRIRKKEDRGIEVEDNLEDFVVPHPLDTTISGSPFLISHILTHPFLISNMKDPSNVILMFTTEENLDHLSHAKYWVMDGTFKSAPNIFYQIYTIHGYVGGDATGRTFPFVYFLLSNKTEETYRKALKELEKAMGQREVTTRLIITDFEKAMINAVKHELADDIEHGGCYFHFRQSFARKAKQRGLAKKLGNDIDFAEKFNMLSALAFLPPDAIPSAFDTLASLFPEEENVESFLEYVEKNYIRGKITRIRRNHPVRGPPKFPPEFWSVHQRTVQGLPRTQNAIEGWHNRLNGLISSPHPSPLKCVELIRKEEHTTTAEVRRLLRSGGSISTRRINLRAREGKIQELLQSWETMPLMAFLQSVLERLRHAAP